MTRLSYLVLALLLVTGQAVANPSIVPEHFEIRASTQEFNRLVFPEPYSQVVIPPDAQLQEAPVPLANFRGLLIRPAPGADDIPVFIQLISGDSFTVRLVPGTSADGAVFRYKGAEDISRKPPKEQRAEDGWIARTIIAAFEEKIPAGFELVEKPVAAKLQYKGQADFQLVFTPLAQYAGGRHSLKVYRLSSNMTVNVEPRDFYKEGLVAAAVETDVVGPNHHPLLVVLEAIDD